MSLFPAYASGRNLAESFYAAMPYLSWQTIIVGDPLCTPFPRTPLSTDEMDPPIDADTQLPTYFAKRQLARAAGGVQTADMMWHAAVIHAAANDLVTASAELNAALNADPTLEKRADVKKLRLQLGGIEK